MNRLKAKQKELDDLGFEYADLKQRHTYTQNSLALQVKKNKELEAELARPQRSQPVGEWTKAEAIRVWRIMRKHDSSIPDEILDAMRDYLTDAAKDSGGKVEIKESSDE